VTLSPSEAAREPEAAARIEQRSRRHRSEQPTPRPGRAWKRSCTELLALYGPALERDGEVPLVLAELEKDHVVAGILSIHWAALGVRRGRVERALDEVRPYIGSHAAA
jgi:hypothetical protein